MGGRVVLCALRAIYVVLASLVMLLALAGVLTPGWVFAAAALSGIVRPNDLVMRNALIGETIPAAHRMGALGVSRASTDSARAVGALTGAGLSTALGIGFAYAFVATFYAASLGLTFGIARRRLVPDPAASSHPVAADAAVVRPPRTSRGRDLKDGLVHVLKTPALLAAMWLAFLINLTAYPVSGGLLPYVAKDVYRVDATHLGWLVASFSLGGLVGSLTMIVTGGSRRPARTMLVGTAAWYALLLGFGHLRSVHAGILTLFLAGFVQNLALISMTVTLLAAAGDRFRGRVMGVRTLAVYGLPLGLMAAGALVDGVGFPLTVSALATSGLVFTLVIGLRWRDDLWWGTRRPTETTPVPQGA